jgi:hypothetical protein
VTNVWQFGIQVNLCGKYCITVWLTVSKQDLFITVTDLWVGKDNVTLCKSWKLITNGDVTPCIIIDTKWEFVVIHMSWMYGHLNFNCYRSINKQISRINPMKPAAGSWNQTEFESFISRWAKPISPDFACLWPLSSSFSPERVCPEGLRSPRSSLAYS